MFAVVVIFTLAPGTRADFMPLMQENARMSLEAEPGCRQFDIATDTDRPDEVFLYEIYDDAKAFEVHLASDHFASFSAATAAMIAAKTVRTYRQVIQ